MSIHLLQLTRSRLSVWPVLFVGSIIQFHPLDFVRATEHNR